MGKFKYVVCGGTFDLLHLGHKALIKGAVELSEKVLLGITSDNYVRNFKTDDIQNYSIREKAVEEYLNSLGLREKVKIVPIDNAYEPYLTVSADYDAIVVTANTKDAALEINEIRRQNKLSELEIIIVPLSLAKDEGQISSTRIRNGEIDRSGTLYINPQWKNKNLTVSGETRAEFKSPWGKVEKELSVEGLNPNYIVVVGDHTALEFNKHNANQFLSIIDFKIQREIRFKHISELGFKEENIYKVISLPGRISWDLVAAIQTAFIKKEKSVILIDGEDDLAVLPVILIAPLGFSIFYGQPNIGVVRVYVTEEIKKRAYNLSEKLILG